MSTTDNTCEATDNGRRCLLAAGHSELASHDGKHCFEAPPMPHVDDLEHFLNQSVYVYPDGTIDGHDLACQLIELFTTGKVEGRSPEIPVTIDHQWIGIITMDAAREARQAAAQDTPTEGA